MDGFWISKSVISKFEIAEKIGTIVIVPIFSAWWNHACYVDSNHWLRYLLLNQTSVNRYLEQNVKKGGRGEMECHVRIFFFETKVRSHVWKVLAQTCSKPKTCPVRNRRHWHKTRIVMSHQNLKLLLFYHETKKYIFFFKSTEAVPAYVIYYTYKEICQDVQNVL